MNPLSIDPNERVTPSHVTTNGDAAINGSSVDGDPDGDDQLSSLALTDIGVIPPPPMFSCSPSPPPPPLPPTASSIVVTSSNHQVFHTNNSSVIAVDGSASVPPTHIMDHHPDHPSQYMHGK